MTRTACGPISIVRRFPWLCLMALTLSGPSAAGQDKDTGLSERLREAAKYSIPAGGLYATAPELARLYRMRLNRGTDDGRRYLSESSVDEMTHVQTGELKTGFTEGMGWGLGWGWALWNFRGSFGILDSDRADVTYDDWHGNRLDRAMLELLQPS